MTTAYYAHDDCLKHITPGRHPERVERLQAVAAALDGLPLVRREAPLGEVAEIARVHPQRYIDKVRDAIPQTGSQALDPDTHVSPGSWNAALRGVGGVCAAVDAVLAGDVANAFVGCRPPGHHAEKERAMGFCLFGNVSIAAKRALDHHGLDRVAIIDFDVHHGNGTQDLLWDEARVLFASSHQMPLYPGTGAASETGAHGNILNVPLDPESAGKAMREAYEAQIFPAVTRFAPQLILVSAGFDAHRNDPLANLNWSTEDFAWITGRICDIADEICGGKVVSTLEGGYDLDALRDAVAAHVKILMERGA